MTSRVHHDGRDGLTRFTYCGRSSYPNGTRLLTVGVLCRLPVTSVAGR